MERIRLTRTEKCVLRRLANIGGNRFTTVERLNFVPAVRSLQQKGLVHAIWSEQGRFIHAMLTESGEAYLFYNPKLRSPVDWGKVAAIATCITAIAAIIALFMVCFLIVG